MRAQAVARQTFGATFRDMRRARRQRRTGGKHTERQWQAVKEFYDFTCLSCERRETEIQLTKDHVNPKGMNDITNIQPLCPDCQDMKKDAYIDFRVSDVAARAIRRAAARRQEETNA
jgi:5-methylcytosine-specific restriction endonuclease McrA